MLKDIFFLVKMFVLTVIVILVMQIRVGTHSIDEHFHQWVKHSVVIDYIEEAVAGGRSLSHAAYVKLDEGFHFLLGKTTRKASRKTEEKGRSFAFGLHRHSDKPEVQDSDEESYAPHAETAVHKNR